MPTVKDKLELKKLELENIKLLAETEQINKSLFIMGNTIAYQKRIDQVYLFRGGIDWDDIAPLAEKISKWREVYQAGDLRRFVITITSPGGSLFDGFGLYDLVRDAVNDGLDIETRVIGWAASMGSLFAQAGSVRSMTPNSYIMLHEAGQIRNELMKLADMRDQIDLLDTLQDRLWSIYADRSHLSVQELIDKCYKKDWWLSAHEALDIGLIDEITNERTV
jgi:ATP-dependent protease ClpP protease subunit